VIGESANATFKNGVLEIVMQAPPAHQQSRGRRLEIKGGENEQADAGNKK
jgi:HSP20 family molecular chaperone IbpA